MNLIYIIILLLLLLILGTFVYALFEEWTLLDSFYHTTALITAVGLDNDEATRTETKIFSALYMLFVSALYVYIITTIISTQILKIEKVRAIK